MSSEDQQAEIIPIPEKFGNAKSKFIRFKYSWMIENFNFDSQYESPIFSPGENAKLKWFLLLKSSLCGTLDLYICLMPCDISELTIKYTVSLVNASGKTVICSLSPRTHQTVSSTEVTEYKVMRDFTTSDTIEGMEEVSPGRKFTIICEIEHRNEFDISSMNNVIKVPARELLDDLRNLFEHHEHTDVTIDVGGREIPAHKAILSIRSPVFSMMFKDAKADYPVKENDVEPDVFDEMLRYIYTDEVPNVKTMPDKLLIAAEKYKIHRLKIICEKTLRDQLTIENTVDTLIIAENQRADQLKIQVIEFITENMAEVMETVSYKAMIDSHPYLKMMTDVIRAMITRKYAEADN